MSNTISFLLDRTGSMQHIKNDVVGGFNAFIDEQKKGEDSKFILTLFDSQSIDTETFNSTKDVPELTHSTYSPRAATPLLDAIGKTIRATQEVAKRTDDRVLFVVYTDGYENASVEYRKETIKKLIEEREAEGWEFIFLGSDMEAYDEAGSMGIAPSHTYSTSGQNTSQTFAAVSKSTQDWAAGSSNYRSALDDEEQRQKDEENR